MAVKKKKSKKTSKRITAKAKALQDTKEEKEKAAAQLRSQKRKEKRRLEKVDGALSKRAAQNRAIRQEAIREGMDATRYLNQIQDDFDTLGELYETVKEAKADKKNPFGARTTIEKAKVQHAILKTKLDTNFRRLAKVLGDLKSVELTDPDGKNPLLGLAAALQQAQQDDPFDKDEAIDVDFEDVG